MKTCVYLFTVMFLVSLPAFAQLSQEINAVYPLADALYIN